MMSLLVHMKYTLFLKHELAVQIEFSEELLFKAWLFGVTRLGVT